MPDLRLLSLLKQVCAYPSVAWTGYQLDSPLWLGLYLSFCLSVTPIVASAFRKAASYVLQPFFSCCWCIWYWFLCIGSFKAGSDGSKCCQLYGSRSVFWMSHNVCPVVVPAWQLCLSLQLWLTKLPAIVFCSILSKNNSLANMYCVLISTYVYTNTTKSCLPWSLKLVAMVMNCIILQQTTRWRIVKKYD